MLSSYLTVKGSGESQIIIEKSRFIAHIARVETEKAALEFIRSIKKQHWNANHNCSAYLIGKNDRIQKANDDGEPSGTAGVPILEVLKKKRLKDTVVVVTRYFGGIKLGTGGLIRAYGKAASEGINSTGIIERKLMTVMRTKIDYSWLGKVENELRASIYNIKQIHYLDTVIIETLVEKDQSYNFVSWINELTNGQGIVSHGETLYVSHKI